MKFTIDTAIAEKQLKEAFKELDTKRVHLSISRSINDALAKTRTVAARAVTSRYNLSYSDVAPKMFVVKSSPKSVDTMLRGRLMTYNNPFSLSKFNPKEIRENVVTSKTSKKAGYSSRKQGFLKAGTQKITTGVVVEVVRGEKKVIQSAYLSFRQGRSNPTVAARGSYEGGRGFNFREEAKSKSLRGIGVASVLRSNSINPILQEYAENEYLIILTRELKKRVDKIGEQHSKFI